MRTYLNEFMVSYDYPAEAISALLQAYDVLGNHADFQQLLAIYHEDRFCDYKAMLSKCKETAGNLPGEWLYGISVAAEHAGS